MELIEKLHADTGWPVVLAANPRRAGRFEAAVFLLVIVFLGLRPAVPTYASDSNYAEDLTRSHFGQSHDVGDERGVYYPYSGLLRLRFFGGVIPLHGWRAQGEGARANGMPVVEFGREGVRGYSAGAGYFGFYAGPKVHVLDSYALGDPLLARLPTDQPGEWAPGHLHRRVPSGYFRSLESGENKICSRALAEYYEHIRLVTRGPFWSWQRLREAWNLAAGRYEAQRLDYVRAAPEVWLSEISDIREEGSVWDAPGNMLLDRGEAVVRLERASHTREMDMSLERDGKYRIEFAREQQVLAAIEVGPYPQVSGGLHVYHIDIPPAAYTSGFDGLRLTLLPPAANGSIGHVRLYS